MKDNEIKDNEIKDNEIKDNEIKDNEIKDNEIKDNEIKDNEIKDNEIKDNEIKDNEIKDNEAVFNQISEFIKSNWVNAIFSLVSLSSIAYLFSNFYIISYASTNNLEAFKLSFLTESDLKDTIFFGMVALLTSLTVLIGMAPFLFKALNDHYEIDNKYIDEVIFTSIMFAPIFSIITQKFCFLALILFPLFCFRYNLRDSGLDKKYLYSYLFLLGITSLFVFYPLLLIADILIANGISVLSDNLEYVVFSGIWLVFCILFSLTIKGAGRNYFFVQLTMYLILSLVAIQLMPNKFMNGTARVIGLQDSKLSWYVINNHDIRIQRKRLNNKKYSDFIRTSSDCDVFIKGKMISNNTKSKVFCFQLSNEYEINSKNCFNFSDTPVKFVFEETVLAYKKNIDLDCKKTE